jgi:hypothetical protein
MPIESEPIDPDRPYGRAALHQAGAARNLAGLGAGEPGALALAKSLNISDETMSLAFGEQAEVRRGTCLPTGEHAAISPPPAATKETPDHEDPLSQRIEDAQNDLTAKRDKLDRTQRADDSTSMRSRS